VSDALIDRTGPQARKPSKCLNGWSYGERLAKEAFWSPAARSWKKDSDRAITPAGEAVHVPAHVVLPGPLQAKQLHYLHVQIPLGQSCHRQKMSFTYVHRVASVVSDSLQPCGLWPARLLCQGGGFSRQEYSSIPFLSTFPSALAANPAKYLVLPEPLWLKQLHHLHTWSSQGQNQVLQGSLRNKPQWMTHIQRWQ